jgi:hypothetical protein
VFSLCCPLHRGSPCKCWTETDNDILSHVGKSESPECMLLVAGLSLQFHFMSRKEPGAVSLDAGCSVCFAHWTKAV